MPSVCTRLNSVLTTLERCLLTHATCLVHRFSNGTMPFRNLFKVWWSWIWIIMFVELLLLLGFLGVYLVLCQPSSIYTPDVWRCSVVRWCCNVYFVWTGFVLPSHHSNALLLNSGNLSIHLLLRDLRPPGSKERKIPYPNSNPLTGMFNLVSCPNYTYEGMIENKS